MDMSDGARFYFKMYGQEWSAVITRREVALARKCEVCGAIPKKDTGFCRRSSIEISEIERAEYWRGNISEELEGRMLRQIRKELKHNKRICWTCEERAEEMFLEGHDGRVSFDSSMRQEFGE